MEKYTLSDLQKMTKKEIILICQDWQVETNEPDKNRKQDLINMLLDRMSHY